MSTILELLAEARETGDFTPLMTAIPYARFLGVGAALVDGEQVGHLRFRDDHVGNPAIPAIHGGILGALLESTAICTVMAAAETVTIPKTITLTIDYLRSAKPRDVYAKASITRQGRRVVTVHVEAWQEERARPVATANVHLLLKPASEE